MIVQKNPALVLVPPHPLLWLQAYPHGYHSEPYPNLKPMQQTGVLQTTTHTFRIPASWLDTGHQQAHNLPAPLPSVPRVNPWHCQPTHLPCGKTGTDYWACNKPQPRILNPKSEKGAVH